MALDDRVFHGASRQAGIFRLERLSELFELPKIFSGQPLPKGNRLGIMTYTGAVGVIGLDEGAKYGLDLASLTPETQKMLDAIFPGMGTVPVDLGPVMAAVRDFFPMYPKVLNAVMGDAGVHLLFNILWCGVGKEYIPCYVQAYEALREQRKKPIATWVYGPKNSTRRELTREVEHLGFPVFSDPETCIKALGLSYNFSRIAQIPCPPPPQMVSSP